MTKEEASCWAQNNGSTNCRFLPKEILQETDTSIIREFLNCMYWSQDYGCVTTLEVKEYEVACGIQILWLKLGIYTDRTMPLKEWTGTRNIVRPLSLLDESRITSVLWG